jgi:dienelactone hydrolase
MAKLNVKNALFLVFLTATTISVIRAEPVSPGLVDAPPVHALFGLESPTAGPFPSDAFTVPDTDQTTGRRVNLPLPADCVAFASDCEDTTLVNRLDGFNQHPRVSIPFDGPIDISTATSENIFLVSISDAGASSNDRVEDDGLFDVSVGETIGINQVIWNPASSTLHAYADHMLDEHARYALVVTTGVHDTAGNPIARSANFERYLGNLAMSRDENQRWYRRELMTAEWAARRVAVPQSGIAVVSMFTTQSSTYQVEQIHRQVAALPASVVDFNLLPGGGRAIFPIAQVAAMSYNAQTTADPTTLTIQAVALPLINFVPGAVGRVAFGRFESADYMVHPGEYIPETASRSGALLVQGYNTINFTLYLPSGVMPPDGWPVMIFGPGSGGTHHAGLAARAAIAASHGMAVVGFSMVGHAFGPNSTFTVRRTDGSSLTFPNAGRGIDQNGDGVIGSTEGSEATAPRLIRRNSDAMVQNAADLMQLVRLIQGGVDADGDGVNDVDAGRIYYFGYSMGGKYGTDFVAFEPAVRAAVFAATGGPLIDNRRIAPGSQFRGPLGAALAARMPSLLNSAYGLTDIGGIPVAGPYFNENIPLRDQLPLIDDVPGAEALQTYFDHATWITNNGNPAAFARTVRSSTIDIAGRPVLYQMFRSDQSESNPLTSELIRAGGLEDRVVLYRHDLFWQDHPTVMKDPHMVLNNLLTPTINTIAIAGQEQIVQFLLSNGATIIHPSPAKYWEVPITGPMPDDFAFIR